MRVFSFAIGIRRVEVITRAQEMNSRPPSSLLKPTLDAPKGTISRNARKTKSIRPTIRSAMTTIMNATPKEAAIASFGSIPAIRPIAIDSTPMTRPPSHRLRSGGARVMGG